MELNSYIDHTVLKQTATKEDIINLCDEAIKYNFYSVCVNPSYVKLAKDCLKNTSVKIACVIGFPLGANTSQIKKQEALEAVSNGASELDMVVNLGLFKNGKYKEVIEDINSVCEAGVPVKVIIETSMLTISEIEKMCEIVNKSNALFIKTSTGFFGEGAKVEHIALMKKLMDPDKKIKASGGIRDKETMLAMINAGANRIGTSSGVKIILQ